MDTLPPERATRAARQLRKKMGSLRRKAPAKAIKILRPAELIQIA
jgi:hypothetical protein